VGAGTGLVVIARAVDNRYPTVGAILLYLSPAFSWFSGVAIYFIQVQTVRYFERRMVKNAKKTLVLQLQSEHTTPQHKARIRKILEEVETSQAAAELARIRQLGLPPRVFEPPTQKEPAGRRTSTTRRRSAGGTGA
jgi:hypothetical protein